MSSLLYQIGNFVGSQVKNIKDFNHQEKEILLDFTNGKSNSDGITEPTSSFSKAVLSATKFHFSRIKISNSSGSVSYPLITLLKNQILTIDGSENSERLKVVFSALDVDKSIVAGISLFNSYLEVKNIEFSISNEIVPSEKFEISAIPFFSEYSTLVFKDCKFSYSGSYADLLAFIAGRGSSIYLYNCEFENSDSSKVMTFCFSPSFQIPNLLAYDELTKESENFILKDKDSYFIQISKP
jgi:hypothetical protein